MVRASLAVVFLLAAVVGCVGPPNALDGPTTTEKYVVHYRTDPPAVQDATLGSFVAAVASGSSCRLVLVETTVEGQDILYSVEPVPASAAHDVKVALDARADSYWGRAPYRVYLVTDARIILAKATPDPTPLSPAAGSGRGARDAVQVLARGHVIFDSSKSYPVLPAAEDYRK